MDQNQYIIETIVRMLLDTSGATVSLVDKVWETWTPEQRKFFTDKAYDIAQEKMPGIISKTLYDVRGGYNNDPLSTSIRRKLDDAFKSGAIGASIDKLIDAEAAYWREHAPSLVERAFEKIVNAVLSAKIGQVDLSDVLGHVKKEREERAVTSDRCCVCDCSCDADAVSDGHCERHEFCWRWRAIKAERDLSEARAALRYIAWPCSRCSDVATSTVVTSVPDRTPTREERCDEHRGEKYSGSS